MQSIQTLMFRLEKLSTAEPMYLFGKDYFYLRDQKSVFIKKNGIVDTGTYFNAFSIEKWKKYTNLQTLFLKFYCKGSFTLKVINHWLTAGDYLQKCLYEKTYESNQDNEIKIDLTEELCDEGIVYFIIEAHSDCLLSDVEYVTNQTFNEKKIALAICTYKRENYIYELISDYNKYELKQNIGIFIADNGKSLDRLENEGVHIYENKNAGGAAGFARCMLEVSEYNKLNNNFYDYITLMDDDICLDFQIFHKIISFISLIKPEYSNYFIAGSMCSLDYPYLRYEQFSSWRGNGFVQFGENDNLTDRNTVIRSERENYFKNRSAGWWFCGFSMKILNDNNYPFPCFFRGDDMEFTIRNGNHLITLNGVCVWHEPFYKKYSIVNEYYYLVRNTLVINALYLKEMTAKQNIKYLYKKVKENILKYDYDAVELVLQAAEDYLKGTDFFKETDAEKFNKNMMKKNHTMEPINQLIDEYKFEDIEKEIYLKNDKSKLGLVIRRMTINGQILPRFFYKSFGFALVGFGAKNINFYKTYRVLNFDPFTKKGYYTVFSRKRALKIIFRFVALAGKVFKNQNRVVQDYQIHLKEACTKVFWEKYLELESL